MNEEIKDLTLNQTWILCLRMWRWVSKQKGDVRRNKRRWLNKNGFRNKPKPVSDCFFCEYANSRSRSCDGCPGFLVDKSFSCLNKFYHFYTYPKEFYQELLRLNKIRKLKKSKKEVKK